MTERYSNSESSLPRKAFLTGLALLFTGAAVGSFWKAFSFAETDETDNQPIPETEPLPPPVPVSPDIIQTQGKLVSERGGVAVFVEKGTKRFKPVLSVINLALGGQLVPIYIKRDDKFQSFNISGLRDEYPKAMHLTNGGSYGLENPNLLQPCYPLKYQGEIITYGWADPSDNYPGKWRALAIDRNNQARIIPLGTSREAVKSITESPAYPTIISGLDLILNTPKEKRGNKVLGRTCLGVAKGGQQIIIMNKFGTLPQISDSLNAMNIPEDQQLLMDGSASFRSFYKNSKGEWHINYDFNREIPLALAAM